MTVSSTSKSSSDTTFEKRLHSYARLVVQSGCALKNGQELYISAAIDCVPFVRLLTQEAYALGARHVTVKFHDEKIARMHYDHCALDVFENFPEWAALLSNSMAREGAAILSITSEDPEAMAGIDPAKPVANARAAHEACKEFYDALDFGRNVWCIVGAAAPAWAKKVFPNLSENEAVSRLWDAIFTATRADTAGPSKAWEDHRAGFDERKAQLNAQRFDALHYTNSRGTDLIVGLTDKHVWQGGGDVTVDGTAFFPNMPTEEIFTTPDRMRADGVVHSALPLVYNGTLIEDFSLTFEKGRAVSCTAAKGYETLKSIIETDENACRLGEVALVPYTSPIRKTGILFYNTLFDENASCHLAVGQGFPDCYEGGCEMNQDALLAVGVNKSATHVDFMIGTEDLRIEGIKADDIRVPIFENGVWAS